LSESPSKAVPDAAGFVAASWVAWSEWFIIVCIADREGAL
jgi:hypothetical protein